MPLNQTKSAKKDKKGHFDTKTAENIGEVAGSAAKYSKKV